MNITKAIDSAIAAISPQLAIERAKARRQLQNMYSGAQRGSRHRSDIGAWTSSPDNEMQIAGRTMAAKARWLDANNSYSTGGLDGFVADVVGTGISTEPLVSKKDGTPHVELNGLISKFLREWGEKAHMQGEYSLMKMQTLAVRTYARDGECFIRSFEGLQYPHLSLVPLSFEMLESEQCPCDFEKKSEGIRQGIRKNSYRQPISYFFHPVHPQDTHASYSDLIEVSASDVIHLKHIKRINQTRGVSKFHAIINEVQDIAEIDEYERIAAKQGAAIGLAVHRNEYYEQAVDEDGKFVSRPLITEFYPGITLDDLDVGEQVEMLNPNGRPNPNLIPFRDDILRALSTGAGFNHSQVSQKLDGSYSAERQKLINHWSKIKPVQNEVIVQMVKPMYIKALQTAVLYGQIKIPWEEIDIDTLFFAAHHAPNMPWIDPLKEANFIKTLLEQGVESKSFFQRQRNRNPEDVRREQSQEREHDQKAGLTENSTTGSIKGVST